ncbi:hypothetical protein D3C79_527970 [compost metagenome]
MLGALILALHHQPGRQVGDADGGVGLVDVLTTGPGGAEGVYLQLGGVDLDLFGFRHFRQHGHGTGGGVHPALGFGLGYPLHPVTAGLELEAAVDVLAVHLGDHLLVATVLAVVAADDGDAPALAFGVTGVHAEQIPREDGRLVATGAGTDLEITVVVILGVARQQHHLQRLLLLLEGRLGERQLLLRHLAQVGVILFQHHLGGLEVLLGLTEALEGVHYVFELGIFPGQGTVSVLIRGDPGLAEQGLYFFVALDEAFQLSDQ